MRLNKHLKVTIAGLVLARVVVVLADSPSPFGYLPYTAGHMDIGVRWVNDELVGYWKNDFATINGQTTAPDYAAAGVRALGIFDANTPPLVRPPGSQWDFLGVEEGGAIYILPAGGVPNTLPYLGLSTEDPSLAAVGAEEYRFILAGMTGPAGGVFSLHVGSSFVPMNTLNGFPAGSILIESGDHLHYNWSFSHLGTYDLYFEFEALDGGGELIATGQDMFRFQITDGGGFKSYDHWRRTVFTPEAIEDDAISGPNSVPLDDEVHNWQRYAFGGETSLEWIWIEEDGQQYPGVQVRLRKRSGEIEPRVQFATTLTPANWSSTGASLTLVEQESIFHDPGMEIHTYRVDPLDQPLGFLRLQSEPTVP